MEVNSYWNIYFHKYVLRRGGDFLWR
jgi:hypothetical protein